MNIAKGTTHLYCCITKGFSVFIDISGASADIAESPVQRGYTYLFSYLDSFITKQNQTMTSSQ